MTREKMIALRAKRDAANNKYLSLMQTDIYGKSAEYLVDLDIAIGIAKREAQDAVIEYDSAMGQFLNEQSW